MARADASYRGARRNVWRGSGALFDLRPIWRTAGYRMLAWKEGSFFRRAWQIIRTEAGELLRVRIKRTFGTIVHESYVQTMGMK